MLTDGGHPNAWDYTPREFFAYFILAKRRKRLKMAEQLSLHAMAARGDEKAVEKARREWGKNGW